MILKRIMSKKSGFTLVEIVVAFAIFAIMAAMIAQILNLVTVQRKNNQQFMDTLKAQEENLAANGYVDKFDESENTVKLKFTDGTEVTFDYQMKAANGAEKGAGDGLAYFISEASAGMRSGEDGSYLGGNGDNPGGSSVGGGSGASQMSRMDSRIIGTPGFNDINVYQPTKTQRPDGKWEYTFEFSAGTTKIENGHQVQTMAPELTPYAQYKVYFYDTDESKATTTQKTDANGNPYTQKTYAPAKIVEVGYLNGAERVPLDKYDNKGGYNPYKVELLKGTPYSNTIRIGTPFCTSTSWSSTYDPGANGFVVDGTARGKKFDTSKHTKIYVVFDGDPNITMESFGEGGVNNGGKITYSENIPMKDANGDVMTDKNGNTVYYKGFYGAYDNVSR